MLALAGLLVSCGTSVLGGGLGERTGELVRGGPAGRYLVPQGIHKIKHVIVVMQENRSFDEYFGTYPGADGIPRRNGKFTVCVPDVAKGTCERPYHDPSNRSLGGPHDRIDAIKDVAGGKMDGFIAQEEAGKR